MTGLQNIQKNPNMTMMDDFILDVKWEQSVAQDSKLGKFQQANTKNALQMQFQTEVQNTFEQGMKGAMQAEQSLKMLDSNGPQSPLNSKNPSVAQLETLWEPLLMAVKAEHRNKTFLICYKI